MKSASSWSSGSQSGSCHRENDSSQIRLYDARGRVVMPRAVGAGDKQLDLLAASFADIPIRDQRDMMERPFFSLAKRPRVEPIQYKVGPVWIEVSANPHFGMATIWDADILIWAATQVREALDRDLKAS